MEFLATSLLELITQTSTNLPPDVRAAMSIAAGQETPGTQSSQALDIICANVDMALEDLAGTRIGRPFDVDTMTNPTERITKQSATLTFRIP